MIQVYDKYGKVKFSGTPGAGTVTSFSAGNLSPLFTTSVTSPTSTPNISFTRTSQAQNLFYASPNGASGLPTFRSILATDLPSLSSTYVPITRTLTINGVTFDLSADRTWTIAPMVYPGVGIPVSTGTAWGTSIIDNSTDWNTAYTDRLKWDGGTTGLVASTGRTSLGATIVGSNLFTLNDPSAITFIRINADNSISTLDASTFRTAIGAGTSSTTGTVTSVAALTLGTTGTDITSTVANGTTTPVITLNVPTASATNRGALSSADWTIFSNKLNSASPSYTGLMSGTGAAQTGSSAIGIVDLSQTWNTTGTPTAIRLNVTNTASNANSLLMDLQVGGSSQFQVTRGGNAGTVNITNFTGRTLFLQGGSSTSTNIIESNNSYSGTSGVFNIFSYSAGFSPTSGNALLRVLNIAPTINQTGGANGITRGLFINPTLTSAFDFRAIETTNGKVILTDTVSAGSGSLAGSLLDLSQTWNTTGTPTAIRLNVTDTASNTNSNLIDLRVGNVPRFSVTKSGTVIFGSTTNFSSIIPFGTSNADARLQITAGQGGVVGSIPLLQINTNNAITSTSTNPILVNSIGNFAPTSGTATYSNLQIAGTINQTGGANGITRGLFINPTLTSAADFRGIEVVTGSIVLPYVTASSTYAIRTQDYLVNFTSGTFTATLPTAVGCAGKEYRLKNSGTGAITIATTSSQTIDGVTTYSLPVQWRYVTVVSTGANWIIMENN